MQNHAPHRVIVELQNVGVFYSRASGFMRSEQFWALRDVSFDVRAGETLGIIGSNGAGKSTLLQLLAGILSPSRGRLESRAAFATLLSLQVGFVPNLSGRQNAVLSGMLLNVPRTAIQAAMDEIIEFSGLGEFIDQPVNTYSSGMRARLGLSVALQCNPDLLLIDEVLGVGDQEFKERSSKAIQDKIQAGRTVVLTSHSGPQIRSLTDRVAWIEHGCCRMQGPTAQVMDEYEAHLKASRQQATPLRK